MRGWWISLVLACTPVASNVPVMFPAREFGPVPDDPPAAAAEEKPGPADGSGVPGPGPGPKDMSPAPGAAPGPDPRAGETKSIKPGINDPYRGAAAAKRWAKRFERDGREVHDRRAEIIKAMGLGRGMAVADVGAGTGLFTLAFAEAVGPEGVVYAVDLMPNFLAHIREKLDRAKVRHVRLVQATDRSSELPAASVDAIFMSDAYHHLEYPQHTLATLRAALRPGGTLWLIDFKLDANSDAWLKAHVRAGKDQVLRELTAAGFVLVEELGLLQENYFLKLRVAAGP